MDKFFNNAYRGDPGVPHSGTERFVNIWIGSIASSVLLHFYPYMWQLTNRQNFHDVCMLYEQHHWKKAMAKKQPYNFSWNRLPKVERRGYYLNWPVFFP